MDLVDLTVQDFITKLASPIAGPAGGSVSALMALSGIALLQMAASRADNVFCQQELMTLAKQLTILIDEDPRAFAAVIDLQAEPSEYHRASDIKMEQAVTYAIEVPAAIVKHCLAGLAIVQQAIAMIDRSMLSELLVATEALRAGVASSLVNMTVNLGLLENAATAAAYVHSIEQYRQQLEPLLTSIYRQADLASPAVSSANDQ